MDNPSSSRKKNHIHLDVEGIDPTGSLVLGDPASLVIEGWLSKAHQPEDCRIVLSVAAAGREGDITLSFAEFMSANGPFLCQIDFEAEAAGQMSFIAMLYKGYRCLAEDAVAIRVLNPQKDRHGLRRKTGPGLLSVNKKG